MLDTWYFIVICPCKTANTLILLRSCELLLVVVYVSRGDGNQSRHVESFTHFMSCAWGTSNVRQPLSFLPTSSHPPTNRAVDRTKTHVTPNIPIGSILKHALEHVTCTSVEGLDMLRDFQEYTIPNRGTPSWLAICQCSGYWLSSQIVPSMAPLVLCKCQLHDFSTCNSPLKDEDTSPWQPSLEHPSRQSLV